MLDRAKQIIEQIQKTKGNKSLQKNDYQLLLWDDVLPMMEWLVKELEEYPKVSDAMRRAAWMEYPNCDTPYTKIYQIMKRQSEREATGLETGLDGDTLPTAK